MSGKVSLRRSLRLWDLVLYGVVIIQPTAPMPVFGVLSDRGRGHVVTMILIAMVAMLLTAVNYGRMAKAYPSAGSAFTYVGQEISPAMGYVTGWSMVMDYILNPMICFIWCSKAAMNFAPGIPFWAWVIFFFVLFTTLNLRGIETSARINAGLAAAMTIVIVIFLIAATRYIAGHHEGAGFFTIPFYDPRTFHLTNVMGGTSIAVLTYIGFDSISTLSEEVENPRQNILRATVLTCLVVGLLSALEVYVAQLVWPASQQFPDVDTAYVYVAGRVAGKWLFLLMNCTLLWASIGSGMAAQLGAARLLYAMGRSSALPKSFFGVLDPKRCIPKNGVIFVGVVAMLGAWGISYALGAQLLNFGALIAFIGVNAAAFMRYYVRTAERRIMDLLIPALGGGICFLLWLNLSGPAKIAGSIWMILGIAYGGWRTRGFRNGSISFTVPSELEDGKAVI